MASINTEQSGTKLEELPDVLTTAETARVLRMSRNAVYEAIRRKEIPSLRIGRKLLVSKRDLVQMLGEINAAKGSEER
jgi:excisionase family DNA binding protein